MLSWDGALPREAPAAVVLAGLKAEGEHLPGFFAMVCHWIQGVPSGIGSSSPSAPLPMETLEGWLGVTSFSTLA